jgi:TaqI-like C-terminal specificity domain
LVKLPPNVFKDATVTTILLFSEKNVDTKNTIKLKYYEEEEFKSLPFTLNYKQIKENANLSFGFKKQVQIKVATKPLDELISFSLGIKTSNDTRFVKDTKENEDCFKLLRGKDFSRYKINYAQKYIWYRPDLMMEKVGAGPRKLENFKKEKILIKDIATEIIATFDDENYLTTDTISIAFDAKPYDIKFILGLLNSNFIRLWFNTNFEAGLHIKINQLQKIPIVNINLKNPQQKSQHDSIVNCVNQLLAAKQKLAQAKEGRDKDFLTNQCNALDTQIDNLVYTLYSLTNDEISIVEGG